MREIAVVTGTRAEFGLLASSMAAIEAHPDLRLRVVVTGTHLSPAHGNTVEAVRESFRVDRTVHMHLAGDTGQAQATSLGVGVTGLTTALADLAPDVVLVCGDRGEALAAGMAAAHMNVPVAHLHGGDVTGGAVIDDSIRHALTKFAHLHFPVSERSAERVRRLGEDPWRVTVVGAPGLDAVREGDVTPAAALLDRYGFESAEPLALVVQHPVTADPDAAGEQVRATLDALAALDVQVCLVHPNGDPGSGRILDVVESYDFPGTYRHFASLPRADYLGFLRAADVLVGNSSSGIIEAPSFGLPVVDVGPRQAGRERAENTLSAPHDAAAIREVVASCLREEAVRERARACENPYDRGGAGELVADRLAAVALDDRLTRKRLTYDV